MEQDIRKYLYDRSQIVPLYNPVGEQELNPDNPLVIDLTWDVACHTGIYHDQIPATRALLARADVIVCDNQALATTIKKFTPALVAPFMFGFCTAQDVEGDGFTVGLLNHNPLVEMPTHDFMKTAKKLGYKTLLFGGETIDNNEQFEVVNDLNLFAARCDVLLLPALPNTLNSITVALSVMMAGTTVLAGNEGGYNLLTGASGVQLISRNDMFSLKAWKSGLKYLEQRNLDKLKKFNADWAKSVSAESLSRLYRVQSRLFQAA